MEISNYYFSMERWNAKYNCMKIIINKQLKFKLICEKFRCSSGFIVLKGKYHAKEVKKDSI